MVEVLYLNNEQLKSFWKNAWTLKFRQNYVSREDISENVTHVLKAVPARVPDFEQCKYRWNKFTASDISAKRNQLYSHNNVYQHIFILSTSHTKSVTFLVWYAMPWRSLIWPNPGMSTYRLSRTGQPSRSKQRKTHPGLTVLWRMTECLRQSYSRGWRKYSFSRILADDKTACNLFLQENKNVCLLCTHQGFTQRWLLY